MSGLYSTYWFDKQWCVDLSFALSANCTFFLCSHKNPSFEERPYCCLLSARTTAWIYYRDWYNAVIHPSVWLSLACLGGFQHSLRQAQRLPAPELSWTLVLLQTELARAILNFGRSCSTDTLIVTPPHLSDHFFIHDTGWAAPYSFIHGLLPLHFQQTLYNPVLHPGHSHHNLSTG